MPVTLKDIAAKANVSVGTVDRALNKRGRIDPEVAARIRAIAEDLGYKTNSVAKSLAIRKRNLKIAIILHIQHNDYYNEVMRGISKGEDEIRDFGIKIQYYHSRDFNAVEQCALIDQAIADGASAIIIVPINDERVKEKIIATQNAGLPVVFLSSFLEGVPCFFSIHCNYYRSGRIGGRLIHMLCNEEREFLVFTPSLSMLGHQQRLQGLQSYIQSAGLSIAETVEVPSDTNAVSDTYRIASEVLARHPKVRCALFCGNTEAWVKAVSECGRTITNVVYDDFPPTYDALISGVITAAICQEPVEQGYQAIRNLYHHFLGIETVNPSTEILIDNKIIVKESID